MCDQVGIGVAWNDWEFSGLPNGFVDWQWEFATVEAINHNPNGCGVVQQVFVDKSISIGIENHWGESHLPRPDGCVVVDPGKFNDALAFLDFEGRQTGGAALIVLISVWCGLVNVLRKPALVVRGVGRPTIGVIPVGVPRIPFLKTRDSIANRTGTSPTAGNRCWMIKIKIGVDVRCSVTVAVQKSQILFAGQVKPVDHSFFEQRVEVGGVVT